MRRISSIGAILVAVSMLFMLSCAWIFEEEIEIRGTARLSDNPSSGHGGIVVSTNTKSTLTDKDGKFVLSGHILDDTDLTLLLCKEGYETAYKEVTIVHEIPSSSAESESKTIMDVGTITLQRLTTYSE